MKRYLLRVLELLFCGFLLWRSAGAAGGFFGILNAVESRTYTTAAELRALVLIAVMLFLLYGLIFTVILAFSALCGENTKIRTGALAGIAVFFFLYACLYGYPLLDNHFTTAWFMTGKYTATLLRSLIGLPLRVFSLSFSWNDTAAWYAVSAGLLVVPFILYAAVLGSTNFLPVLIASALPAAAWGLGHWCVLKGWQQLLLGAAASVISSVVLYSFTDHGAMGSERKQRGKALFTLAVGNKKRTVLLVLCIALWGVTVFVGRIRSFGAVMRLIFSSSVYAYQNDLYALADLRVAETLLISYVLSLIIRKAFSLIEVRDDSRFAGILNAAGMLLLQIWVLPLLSGFMKRTAESADGLVSAEALETPAAQFLSAVESGNAASAVIGIALGVILLILLFLAAVKLPFLRIITGFLVWFSACTYVYCLVGLFYRSPLDDIVLLVVCYLLNSLLNRIMNSGYRLREKLHRK